MQPLSWARLRPPLRIAACVQTGKDDEFSLFDDIKHEVRKPTQHCSTNSRSNQRTRLGVGCDGADSPVDFLAELSAET